MKSVILFIGLGLFFLLLVLYLISVKRENVVLRESVKRLDGLIWNRTVEVEELRRQLSEREAELRLIEGRLQKLRAKRERIGVPNSTDDIVREFTELGYRATRR